MKLEKQLSQSEITSFCTQIAMLIEAGITPYDSIHILLNDAKTAAGKKIYEQILEELKKGEAFHTALASTGLFPDYCLHLIMLGEESGNLDNCLQSLALYYEKEENISKSIRNAISYPLLMIIMMFIVIYILVSKVLPIFSQVFSDLGSEMTGFAATLSSLGTSLSRYSSVILVV